MKAISIPEINNNNASILSGRLEEDKRKPLAIPRKQDSKSEDDHADQGIANHNIEDLTTSCCKPTRDVHSFARGYIGMAFGGGKTCGTSV